MEAEIRAAELLNLKNPSYLVYVSHNKLTASDPQDAKDKSDCGDVIYFPWDEQRRKYLYPKIVEVKRLSKDNEFAYFQERTDFRNGVIIDGAYQFDRKWQMPIMYMVFNYPLTHFFTAYPERDFEKWEKKPLPKSSNKKLFYWSKAIDCNFYSVDEFVKQYSVKKTG